MNRGPVALGLDSDEREFVARALGEAGGPAHVTDALAAFIGFADAADMVASCAAIAEEVRRDGTMAAADLARAQLACEILFASDLYGSGLDWESTTGIDDAAAVLVLRRVQVKLLRLRFPRA